MPGNGNARGRTGTASTPEPTMPVAIPLAITDVTTALNTGMIDTFYAPPLGALALQWHTNMKYMTSLPLAHATLAVGQ